MNLNLKPKPEELEKMTPVERVLVNIFNFKDCVITEELIEYLEAVIFSFGNHFRENKLALEEEIQNSVSREEPKNIIFVDFSS